MSLGQEFHGWGTTIGEEVQRIAEVRELLKEINLGATAIGTTVTAHPAIRRWRRSTCPTSPASSSSSPAT